MSMITFSDEDFKRINSKQGNPMVIMVEVANLARMKTLLEQGNSIVILYWKTFKKLGLVENAIVPMREHIVSFSKSVWALEDILTFIPNLGKVVVNTE